MVCEAEIIVGAKVQKLALTTLRLQVADPDVRRLRRRDHSLAFQEALGLDRSKLGSEMGKEGVRHGGLGGNGPILSCAPSGASSRRLRRCGMGRDSLLAAIA